MTNKVRITLSLDPHVVERYRRVSSLSGESLSACVNDWLDSTGEALENLTNQILQVKTHPQRVLAHLQLIQEQSEEALSGVSDELKRLMHVHGMVVSPVEAAASGQRPELREDDGGAEGARSGHFPPPSNTGGNLPRMKP